MKPFHLFLMFFLVNNLYFFHFLGIKESVEGHLSYKDWPRFVRLGLILLGTTLIVWVVGSFLLTPWHLPYLETPLSVLALALLSWLVYFLSPPPADNQDSGPWSAVLNSLLLGGALLIYGSSDTWLDIIFSVIAVILAYAVTLLFFSALKTRLLREKIPVVFQGLPLQLTVSGLVALVLAWTGR